MAFQEDGLLWPRSFVVRGLTNMIESISAASSAEGRTKLKVGDELWIYLGEMEVKPLEASNDRVLSV